jgi:hypothetical protein
MLLEGEEEQLFGEKRIKLSQGVIPLRKKRLSCLKKQLPAMSKFPNI